MIDVEHLRQLAEAATPGPWKRGQWQGQYVSVPSFHYTEIRPSNDDDASITVDTPPPSTMPTMEMQIISGCGCCGSPSGDSRNAQYIAAANPATMIALLDELQRLRKTVGEQGAARVRERMEKLTTIGRLRVRIAELEGKTLGVWTSDIDTVVAYDLADVEHVITEHAGSFEQSLEDFRRVEDGHFVTINIDEEIDREKFAPTFVCEKSGFTKARKTASEWVALNGRELLCSTEY